MDRSHPDFPAVAVSLGLLGVISTVTFRCVPAFRLASRHTVRSAQEVIDDFDRINRSSLYVDMLYFPITDSVEILSIDAANGDEVDVGMVDAASGPRPAPGVAGTLIQRAAIACVKGLASMLQSHPLNGLQRAITRRSVGSSHRPRTGRSDLVLAFGEPGPATRSPFVIQDVEVAVPYVHGPAAIAALRASFAAAGRYPLLPIHIRCSAASDLWLSPAYGREVCWLEFWEYPPSNASLAQLHRSLAPFDYRFHWGKAAPADRAYIRQQYPHWDQFERVRDVWDPAGVFSNDYTRAFFGAPHTVSVAT